MPKINDIAAQTLQEITADGLLKTERAITSAQSCHISVKNAPNAQYLNFCANNYMGYANHPQIIAAAHHALDKYGYGMASVRFICGTLDFHQELEQKLAKLLGTEDAILFSSCFDANGGVFEALLNDQDVIISDALNHASIIDGVRLSKAERARYANNNIQECEALLQKYADKRIRLIVTDGVFSMDGVIANLPELVKLAQKYDAQILMDDSHAVGVIGNHGAGTHDYWNLIGKVDIITGTLGKALGGAAGGYVAGQKATIDLLRQKARPYLFSNALPPMIVGGALAALDLVAKQPEKRENLRQNAAYFRENMAKAGFRLLGKDHAIVPILLGDAQIASEMAKLLMQDGIYVTAFSFPVVPKGMARIRTQLSADLTIKDCQYAVEKFTAVAKKLGVL